MLSGFFREEKKCNLWTDGLVDVSLDIRDLLKELEHNIMDSVKFP